MSLTLRAKLKFVQFGYPAKLSGIAKGMAGSKRKDGLNNYICAIEILYDNEQLNVADIRISRTGHEEAADFFEEMVRVIPFKILNRV